jgi:hypothetical protein
MRRTTFQYCSFGLLSSATGEDGKPYWNDDHLDAMDRAFCERMLDAITAGLESCPKGVSTTPGTRHPITNYQRPD